MGRKSRRRFLEQPEKPTCFYCAKPFDTEEILVQHQKASHFKCVICARRFVNIPALGVHMKTVHQKNLTTIPKANPEMAGYVALAVVGSQGLPPWYHEERARKRLEMASSIAASMPFGNNNNGDNDDNTQNATTSSSSSSTTAIYIPQVEGMIYGDESTSPEEHRARLPRYAPELSAKISSVEERLKAVLQQRGMAVGV